MRKSLCIAVITGFVIGLVAQPQPQQNVVPPNYRTLIANAAPANKPDLLARGVMTVQAEVMTVQAEVSTLRSQAAQASNNQEQRIKTLEQGNPAIVQRIQAIEGQDLKSQIDEVRSQLAEFRNATCPLLKNSKLKDSEKAQVDRVCQSNSTTTK